MYLGSTLLDSYSISYLKVTYILKHIFQFERNKLTTINQLIPIKLKTSNNEAYYVLYPFENVN